MVGHHTQIEQSRAELLQTGGLVQRMEELREMQRVRRPGPATHMACLCIPYAGAMLTRNNTRLAAYTRAA